MAGTSPAITAYINRTSPMAWDARISWETTRMSAFEIFAIAWIPIAVAIVIAVGFSAQWIEERLGLAKGHHPAE